MSAPQFASPTTTYAGEATESISSPPKLLGRDWEIRENVLNTGKFKVTIMTWNVLADGLSGLYGRDQNKSKGFAGIADEHLQLEHRIPLMLQEIEAWDCDIVCLQEFDFWDNPRFVSGMVLLGYHEAAHRRKQWSPCLNIGPGHNPDGVALFYKLRIFECHATHTTDERYKRGMRKELASRTSMDDGQVISVAAVREWFKSKPKHVDRIVEGLYEDIKDNGDDPGGWTMASLRRWVDRPSPPCSAGARLVPQSNRCVVLYVTTTHLNSNKKEEGEQRRSEQLMDLLDDPGHVAQTTPHSFIVLDMNGSYQPISEHSKSPLAYPRLAGTLPSNADLNGREVPPMNPDHRFRSATRDYMNGDVEVEWTSLKDRVERDGQILHLRYPVDFLFYPKQGWNVTKISSIVSPEQMDRFGGHRFHLPSQYYPSDHLAMCAEFQMDLE